MYRNTKEIEREINAGLNVQTQTEGDFAVLGSNYEHLCAESLEKTK